MITVYSSPNTRGTRITWLLEELGQDYEFSLVDFSKGDSQSPAYLAINPAGKVPAIRDGDLVLTESGAITTYLSDKYAAAGLIPAVGTAERARYEQWSYFALCELEQGLWTIGKNKFALPAEHRIPDIIPTAQWEFQKALALLSKGLADKPYILGDKFQAVDILLAHTLIWAKAFKNPIEQDNLIRYFDRLTARPALARAVAREQAAKQ